MTFRTIRPVIAVILAATYCAAPGTLRSAWGQPDSESLQHSLLADADDGRLDRFSLLRAALVASGVEREHTLDRLDAQFYARLREFEAEDVSEASQRERAERLFAFLHRNILTGPYDAACSDVRVALETGRFNCVGATVLFQCLCDGVGIAAEPVALPGHVLSRLPADPPQHVETTCPNWFELSRQEDDPQPRLRVDRPGLSAPGGTPRTLSEVQLVAKIFYNRGVALLETGASREAMEVTRIGWQLDPADTAARDNLLAAINNAALQLSRRRQYEQAVGLVVEGLAMAPDHEPLRANDLHIHHKWTAELCRQGRFSEALDRLQRAQRRRPNAELFSQGQWTVYQSWADRLDSEGDSREARRVLAEGQRRLQHVDDGADSPNNI